MYLESQVLMRVVRFVGELGRPGAATLVELNNQEYLATAKHLCLDEEAEQVTVKPTFGPPITRILERVGDRTLPADVAVFQTSEKPIIPTYMSLDLPLGNAGLVITQEAYIVGYPYGLSYIANEGQDTAFEIPIVKSGVLSGHSNGNVNCSLIDTMANPGFSGGPMIYRDIHDNALRLGGVVKGQYFGPATDDAAAQKVPSGLSVTTDVCHIRELITGSLDGGAA